MESYITLCFNIFKYDVLLFLLELNNDFSLAIGFCPHFRLKYPDIKILSFIYNSISPIRYRTYKTSRAQF